MSLKIEGLDAVLADLRKFGDRAEKGIKSEVGTSGTNIQIQAKAKAPFSVSGRRNGIDIEVQTGIKQLIGRRLVDGGYGVEVGIYGEDPFPAYVEFGTGLFFLDLVASDPQNYNSDVKAIARGFWVNGLGELPASPYLFPSFFEERVIFVDNLRRLLDKLT